METMNNTHRIHKCHDEACDNLTLDTWPYCYEHTLNHEHVYLKHVNNKIIVCTSKDIKKNEILSIKLSGELDACDETLLANKFIHVGTQCLIYDNPEKRYMNGHLINHDDFDMNNCALVTTKTTKLDDQHYVNIKALHKINVNQELTLDFGNSYIKMFEILKRDGLYHILSLKIPKISKNRYKTQIQKIMKVPNTPVVCTLGNYDVFLKKLLHHYEDEVNFDKHQNCIIAARCYAFGYLKSKVHEGHGFFKNNVHIKFDAEKGDLYYQGKCLNIHDISIADDGIEYDLYDYEMNDESNDALIMDDFGSLGPFDDNDIPPHVDLSNVELFDHTKPMFDWEDDDDDDDDDYIPT